MLACSQNHDQVVETILPAHYLNHNQCQDIWRVLNARSVGVSKFWDPSTWEPQDPKGPVFRLRLQSREFLPTLCLQSSASPGENSFKFPANWLKGEKDKPLRLGSGGWCLAWWTCHLYPAHPVFETFSSHCWLLNVQCTLLYTFFYYKAAQSWKRKQGHLKQQFPFHPQVLHQAQCFPVQQNEYHYYRK